MVGLKKISFNKTTQRRFPIFGRLRGVMTPKFFILFFTVLVLFVIYQLLSVKKIIVESDNLGCVNDSQLRSSLNLLSGDIFYLKVQDLLYHKFEKDEQNILKKFPCVGSVDYRLDFPPSLNIKINRRVPEYKIISKTPDIDPVEATSSSAEAKVKNYTYGEPMLLDHEGVIFAKDDNLQVLKTISWVGGPLQMGQRLDSGLIAKIDQIIQKIAGLGINADLLEIKNPDLYIDSGISLRFDLQRDIEVQLASLQLIWLEAKINSKVPNLIDLRFDRPVIKYPTNIK